MIPMNDILEFAIHSAKRQAEICRLRKADNDNKFRTGLVRDAKHPGNLLGARRRASSKLSPKYFGATRSSGTVASPNSARRPKYVLFIAENLTPNLCGTLTSSSVSLSMPSRACSNSMPRSWSDWEVMDVGAHRVGVEVVFPQTWCKFSDAASRMLADPLQYIDEVGVRIDAVKSAGDDQTLDDADVLRTEFSPAKKPGCLLAGHHRSGRVRVRHCAFHRTSESPGAPTASATPLPTGTRAPQPPSPEV